MLTATALAAHWGGPGFGFGWLFLLIPLFFFGLFVLFAVVARRRWSRGGWGPGAYGHPHWASAARGAEATLAGRFANGDIDEKEYRARLEVLRANDQFTPPAR